MILVALSLYPSSRPAPLPSTFCTVTTMSAGSSKLWKVCQRSPASRKPLVLLFRYSRNHPRPFSSLRSSPSSSICSRSTSCSRFLNGSTRTAPHQPTFLPPSALAFHLFKLSSTLAGRASQVGRVCLATKSWKRACWMIRNQHLEGEKKANED